MASQKTSLEVNTFVAGLNTEAGPLTFPENASLDESNFVLDVDGSRQRRLGMNYEAGGVELTWPMSGAADTSNVAYATYEWKNASNRGDLDLVVIQVGSSLSFYDTSSETISENLIATFSDVANAEAVGYSASIYGRLVFSNGTKEVLIFTYDANSKTISFERETIQGRDVWGMAETTPVDFRPEAIDLAHDYNLRNQGWPKFWNCYTSDGGGNDRTDPVVNTEDIIGQYPSNSDIIWNGKVTSADKAEAIGRYSSYVLDKNGFGSTQAPRGKNIFTSIFDRGWRRDQFRANTSSISPGASLPVDSTRGSIGPIAAYAGRVFYCPVQESVLDTDDNSPNLGTTIFFSQTASNVDNINKCYSLNDPTAEDFNKPLDTDGGFINIPEIGRTLALEPLGDSLFVFATNGVWEIHGGEGSFSATNQNLSKVSNSGCIGPRSVVKGEGLLAYWSVGGIYAIELDGVSLRGVATNITQNTIQRVFNRLPAEAKATVVGTYDEAARQVRWLTRGSGLSNPYFSNLELVFDLSLKAFYRHDIATSVGSSQVGVVGYAPVPFLIYGQVSRDVTVNDAVVTVIGDDVTVTTRQAREDITSSIKYFTARTELGVLSSAKTTFSEYNDSLYRDWAAIDGTGVDAEAYLLTGYWTGGIPSFDKSIISITTHMRRTESGFSGGDDSFDVLTPSSCLMQAQWAWTDSAASGRWSDYQQAYKLKRFYSPTETSDSFDYSSTVISTRNVLRGKGEALSLRFNTEPEMGCHIYGWSKELTAESET